MILLGWRTMGFLDAPQNGQNSIALGLIVGHKTKVCPTWEIEGAFAWDKTCAISYRSQRRDLQLQLNEKKWPLGWYISMLCAVCKTTNYATNSWVWRLKNNTSIADIASTNIMFPLSSTTSLVLIKTTLNELGCYVDLGSKK